jgi:hypothetical protein
VRGATSDRRPYRDNYPETGLEEINGDVLDADFGPASKSAIKCRIRSALTQAEAAIAIATSLHQ